MKRLIALPLASFAFPVLCYFCVQRHSGLIQRDVTDRTAKALVAQRLSGYDLSVDGRDVTLTGAAGSPAITPEAERSLLAVPGVRTVAVKSIRTVTTSLQADARTLPVEIGVQNKLSALIAERRVEFKPGSARLTRTGRSVLDEVAPLLETVPAAACEIQGHTDSQGDPDRNRALSYRRAIATRRYLIAKGIEAGRLTAKGFGDAEPVASNETASGRQQNRRINFVLKENP